MQIALGAASCHNATEAVVTIAESELIHHEAFQDQARVTSLRVPVAITLMAPKKKLVRADSTDSEVKFVPMAPPRVQPPVL